MKITLEREKKEIEIKFSGTVNKLLLRLHINPETVIVVKNEIIVVGDERLSNSDAILLVSVISGG